VLGVPQCAHATPACGHEAGEALVARVVLLQLRVRRRCVELLQSLAQRRLVLEAWDRMEANGEFTAMGM